MSQSEIRHTASRPPELEGLGGWLILPMLGLIATAGMQVLGLGGIGDLLTAGAQVGGMAQALVVAEIVGNFVIFLILPIILLVLMFQKKRSFPRLFIIYSIVGSAFFFLDLVLGYNMFSEVFASGQAELFSQDVIRGIVSAIAGIVIWVPYMLTSVRVKNTFVN